MHEMSLAEGVLQIIEDTARGAGDFVRVKTVFIEIGQLSSVDPDSMRFCFDAVARGTLAEGAQLQVIEVAGEGVCSSCNKTVPLAVLYDFCPVCGGFPVQVTGGAEMRVKSLEVE